MKTAIVINAGGSGTRLWPVSREHYPKQFAQLINEKSLLRNTYERVAQQYDSRDIFVTTNVKFKELTLQELPEISPENLILEPKKMDTAPAIGLMTFRLKSRGYDTIISLHSDHNIADVTEFLRILKLSEEISEKYRDHLLLIGMNPSYPATGYGYIEMGDPIDRFSREIVFSVNSFKEKPYKELAEKFVSDWRYLWNAGYFIYRPDFLLDKYKELQPEMYELLKQCSAYDSESPEFLEIFSQCEPIAFDYAISEKLHETLVLPASVGWSDIGSWRTIRDIITNNNPEANVLLADVVQRDIEGVLAYSKNPKKKIALLGLKDIVVIDTEETLLVASIQKVEEIKKLIDEIPDNLR